MGKLIIKGINCPACNANHNNIKFYRSIIDYGILSTGIRCHKCNNSLELQEDTGFCDSRNEFEVNVTSILGRKLLMQYSQYMYEWLIIEGDFS